jgi:uncharacterized small protein (DUF1192 family)
MVWDDDQPKPKKGITLGDDLHTFSVGELEARLSALAEEIKRVERELQAKKAHEAAAASLFKR